MIVLSQSLSLMFLVSISAASSEVRSIELFDILDKDKVDNYELNDCRIELFNDFLEVRYGHESDWPNIKFNEEESFSLVDWSEYNALRVTVSNPSDLPVRVNIRVDDSIKADGVNHCRQGGYELKPHERIQLEMDLSVTEPIPGMRGQPPGSVVDKRRGHWISDNGNPLDLSHIHAFQLFMAKPSRDHVIRIHKIELVRYPTKEIRFFVDRFGQYTEADWPGKIHDESEFAARIEEEKADLAQHVPPPDRDRFGGWRDGPRLEATGRFRVQKHDGKWWLVDPDGYLFWSNGIDCVGYSNPTIVEDREYCFSWLPDQGEIEIRRYARLIRDREMSISGRTSVEANTMGTDSEWAEFIWSNPEKVRLKPNATYAVEFKYRMLEKGDDGSLYCLLRSGKGGIGAADRGFTYVNAEPGDSGKHRVVAVLGNYDDYRIVLGIRHEARVVVDDLRISEVGDDGAETLLAEYDFDSAKPRDPLADFYGTIRGKRSYDFFQANLFRKYGEGFREKFINLAADRLLSWGFNTIANWSSWEVYQLGRIPYVMSTHTGGSASIELPHKSFPDVFHPDFAAELAARLRGLSRFKDDPRLIGVFIDNELPWWNIGEMVLREDEKCYSKLAVLDYLKSKYGGVGKLNDSWGTAFSSWDQLREPFSLTGDSRRNAQEDITEANRIIARRYFQTCRQMMNEYMPGVLYLGPRFNVWAPEIITVSAEYCDIVSFNIYSYLPTEHRFDDLAVELDFPMIIGEFHFGALDRGMFHTGLREARDQEDRAEKYAAYVEEALRHPNFVGAHWFQYLDQPLTGRFDGENYNIGFININDTPYPELRAAARRVNADLYRIRSGH